MLIQNCKKRLTALCAALLLAVVLVHAGDVARYEKLSPRLNRLLSQQQTAGQMRKAPANQRMEVLVKLDETVDEDALLARYDARVETRIGRVLVVSVPMNRLPMMASDEGVTRMEAEQAARKMLDIVPSQIGADKAHAGTPLPQAFTGKNVVVGIVDVGFDYTHPMFKDAEGNSRIVRAAHYLSSPATVLTSGTEILATRYSPDPYEYHGTHVAGIAVGSRVTRTFDDLAFIGIAPEADIATGCINLTGNSPILNPADPTSASALKAFSEIFNFADAQQKPCVINFSAGISQTMANNRQLEEEAIRTMLQKPGHVMVVAAGNQGWYHYLMHKEAAMQQAGAGVRFHQEDVYGAYLGVELKMKPDQTLRIRYTNDKYTANHAEATLKASEVTGTKPFVLGSTGIYRKNLTATLTEKTGDGYVIIYLSCDDSTFPDTDRLLLTIEGDGEAWMYADTSCAPLEDVAGVDNHNITTDGYTVAWPGSMPEVITVGNIGWRYVLYGTYGVGWDLTDYERGKGEGYLARSSSCGPTLTGLTKPDVCAPGVNVISALSNGLGDGLGYEAQAALDAQLQYQWMGFCDEESDDYHMMLTETGTSMSAPAVAGTVALWLQADPTLTTEDIKTLLAQTSRQPDSDLTYPNNQYGHGEVDAYKGLLQLLGLSTGIDAISSHQPRLTQIRLDGRCLQLAMEEGADEPFTVSIYATDGRLLLHADSQQRIDLSRLPTGIYAVQVSTGRASTTGSTLIRIGN